MTDKDDQSTIFSALSRRDLLNWTGKIGGAAAVAATMPKINEFLLGSTPAHAADKPLNVAVLGQQMSAQSDQRSWAGMQAWIKGVGVDKSWKVNLTDAKGDPGKLVSQIQDAVTSKVDAIVVLFGTLTAAHAALESVKNSNIPFFSIDSGWQAPAIADLTSNNYNIGGSESQYMVDRLLGSGKDKAKVAAIIANFHHGTRKRGKVLETLLTENTWIEQVDSRVIQYAGFYENTQNIVNDWLTRYGDELDCIWCPWDEPAMAASEAIVSKGLQKKIFVVGADGHPTALQRMRDVGDNWPQKSTCAQAFELWGAYCGWLVNEIVGKGGDAKKLVPVPIVEFPAPLLVSGVNLPKKDEEPWQATDLYYIYQERVVAGMKG
ncbi:MAG: sugar ABC transporter substrate-binding protein [Rhizobiales bacterium]|nr:sugar ABC transporter substrate-binding protein [Hyphomicrobiales bacterium]